MNLAWVWSKACSSVSVRGRRSIESRASLCTTPTGSLPSGVAFPPIAGNGITGAGEPFFVAAELFQRFRGKKLRTIAGGMSERFQESRPDQQGNLVRIEAKKPCCPGGIEPGGNHLPTQKFGLLFRDIHLD